MSGYVYQVHSKKNEKFNLIKSISVNLWLISLTVICFIIFFTLINLNIITIDQIAIKPANILEGKYLWTFLTSMFMHGGLAHLFVNMFSMIFIGSLVEKLLGRKRYFWFYIISGLAASVFFVLIAYVLFLAGYPGDYNAVAVGASGALFALVGFLMIITPNLPVLVFFVIPTKMKYAGPGLLILLWLISVFGNIPIGNTAHFGGLIVGVAYGIYIKKKYKKKSQIIKKYFS